MAVNDGPIRNEFNRASDWVEFYNNSSASYDMSGMGLGDSIDGTIRWTFPPGTIIPNGGYLVVGVIITFHHQLNLPRHIIVDFLLKAMEAVFIFMMFNDGLLIRLNMVSR
jgi:hypothetical protein